MVTIQLTPMNFWSDQPFFMMSSDSVPPISLWVNFPTSLMVMLFTRTTWTSRLEGVFGITLRESQRVSRVMAPAMTSCCTVPLVGTVARRPWRVTSAGSAGTP